MPNVTLVTKQASNETDLSFDLTGQSGTSGFGNITVPKIAVFSRSLPTVYIDNQTARNQGNTQDEANYYVWYTIEFSNHNVNCFLIEANSRVS
jgi:hypothetical protein